MSDTPNTHDDDTTTPNLATLPPEQRCYCGWHRLGECYTCNFNQPNRTCADKLRERAERKAAAARPKPIVKYDRTGNIARTTRTPQQRIYDTLTPEQAKIRHNTVVQVKGVDNNDQFEFGTVIGIIDTPESGRELLVQFMRDRRIVKIADATLIR